MASLASIVTAAKREALGRDLRASGFSEAADIIDKLVDFARDEIYLLDEMYTALGRYMLAEQDMHTVYANTATCHGGAGGMALTPHCAHVCTNTRAHERQQLNYAAASLAVHEIIMKTRNA